MRNWPLKVDTEYDCTLRASEYIDRTVPETGKFHEDILADGVAKGRPSVWRF
jgi:hypothetical protein